MDPMDGPMLLKIVIRKWIAPLLKTRGYSRSGTTWRKSAGPLTYIVNVQRGKWSRPDAAEFFLNGSVYLAPLDELLGRSVVPTPFEYDGHIRLRPHRLPGSTPQSRPQSRTVFPDFDAEAVGLAAAADLSALIDAIEEFGTAEEAVGYLSQRLLEQYEQVYGWYLSSGRQAAARDFVAGLYGHFGDQARWNKIARNIETVAEHLGFGPGDIHPVPYSP